jgi:toxin FitB
VILVDTNVWSELTKPAPDKRVREFLIDNDAQLWLSVIVIAEIRRGIENAKAAHRRAGLLDWLNGLEQSYGDRIAAQSLSREATIATRNVKDFTWTGVTLINPWDA